MLVLSFKDPPIQPKTKNQNVQIEIKNKLSPVKYGQQIKENVSKKHFRCYRQVCPRFKITLCCNKI